MPNIIITNYCNLSCPYCFANDIIQEEKHDITMNELQNILNFLQRGPKYQYNNIGILGGEPTLHKNFEQILTEIIKFSYNQNLEKPKVFSNGILLDKYSHLFSNNAKVLLNLNSSKIIGDKNWEKIQHTLDELEKNNAFANHNVTLGINLYLNIPDWLFIFDIAKEYNLNRIRCSVVVPAKQLKTNKKAQYYIENKELFLNFLSDAKKYNISIAMDCNKIPLCYFTEKEQEFIIQQTKYYTEFCDPAIDINYDMTAISCFGINTPIDITQFNDLSHLKRYMQLKQIAPLIQKNNIDKCKNCIKMDLLKCYGGCLSFNK